MTSYYTRPITLTIGPTGPIITATLTTTTLEPTTTSTTYSTTTTSDVPPTTTTTTTDIPTTTTTTTSDIPPTSTTSTTSDTTTTYHTATTDPTVPPTLPPSDDGSLSTGAIIGIAVAAAVALIALIFAACMFTRRRRRRKRDLISNPVFSQPVMQENNRPGGGGSGGAVTGNIGKGRPTSQDAMMPSGFSNITAATGGDDRYGYGPETGAAVGGYAYDRQQQLQHRHGQLSYSPPSDHQRVNYTPPNEPEYPQSDMHNADYVQGRPQDDLAYHQYQQEQLYHQQIQMQLEQERLAATAAVTGYYPISRPSEYSPPISNVYPENPDRNPRYSEIEQERRLQRLLHGDPGSTGAYSNHISPAATPTANYQVQEQYQQLVTPSPQDYVDPESDVRYNESEPWVPPTTALPPTPVVVPKVVSSPIPASTSPIVSGKPIAMEAPQGSSLPLSTGSGKRPHAPQEFPEYKRGPQVLIPESIQSIEEVDRAHQQDLMRQQAQDPNTLSSKVMYTPPPPQ